MGEPFLPPPLPSARDLASLDATENTLLELDRIRGPRLKSRLEDSGGVLISSRLQIWRLPSRVAQRLIPELMRLRALRSVEPDRRLVPARSHLGSADPLLPNEWWIPTVGADRAVPPGPGKPVTVIDSGLDISHPEFAGRPSTVLLNAQSVLAAEGEEHGTAVSSVVAAPANDYGLVGVYPQALLQEWDHAFFSDVIAGIDAAGSGAEGVINMSFGGPTRSRILEQALLAAFGQGSILVAASGNEFHLGNPVAYPASYNHVLTVAATNQANQPTYFSNSSLAVDLAAPGEGIPVAVPTWFDASGFSVFGGTSFSAPLVSGATAWVWTRRPRLDNTQVFDLMRWSARDIWDPGFDEHTGFGLLDIPAALSQPAPRSDHQEPNDDIYHVKANGLFRQATAPLTRRGQGRRTLRARLDATEDPEDVYRVWAPVNRWVNIRVRGNRNVDVDLWKPGTPSVYVRGNRRRRYLIDWSYRRGTRPDWVFARNTTRRGSYIYLDVFLPRNGPLDATYSIKVTTTRT